MAVPWAQIVRLMPSIVELSHELLKRTRRAPESAAEPARDDKVSSAAALEARVLALEENERRQAELVTNMADQLEQVTTAVTVLHRQWRVLVGALVAIGIVSVVALILAMRLSLTQ
jgi:uncharacterized coiled-coil protein SlyX